MDRQVSDDTPRDWSGLRHGWRRLRLKWLRIILGHVVCSSACVLMLVVTLSRDDVSWWLVVVVVSILAASVSLIVRAFWFMACAHVWMGLCGWAATADIPVMTNESK